jgi:hypothetical protein
MIFMPEKDLSELPYTEWLEDTLKSLIGLPTKGILLCAVLENGDIYKDDYNLAFGDRDRIVGLLQRENIVAFMRGNGLIKQPDEN